MRFSRHYLPHLPLYPKPRGPIGLLGGSFNPAHEGHLYIAREARKRLGLSSVWLLVSPQNPLKPLKEMASLSKRLQGTIKLLEKASVSPSHIRVSDMEARLKTRYTCDFLRIIKERYPQTRFVWIMGVDNLSSFHRWRQWERVADTLPILVVNRGTPEERIKALNIKAARKLRPYRLKERELNTLGKGEVPAWGFLDIPAHPASSTAIRERMR